MLLPVVHVKVLHSNHHELHAEEMGEEGYGHKEVTVEHAQFDNDTTLTVHVYVHTDVCTYSNTSNCCDVLRTCVETWSCVAM